LDLAAHRDLWHKPDIMWGQPFGAAAGLLPGATGKEESRVRRSPRGRRHPALGGDEHLIELNKESLL